MKKKGITPDAVAPLNKTALAQEDAERKAKKEDELSDMEVLETNEDIRREETKKLKQKTDEYNKISDEQKGDSISAALGLDSLIQTDQDVKKGIFSSSAENTDDCESLSDLAKNARG